VKLKRRVAQRKRGDQPMQRMPRRRANGGLRHKDSGAEPAEGDGEPATNAFADDSRDANSFHISSFFASILEGGVGHLPSYPFSKNPAKAHFLLFFALNPVFGTTRQHPLEPES